MVEFAGGSYNHYGLLPDTPGNMTVVLHLISVAVLVRLEWSAAYPARVSCIVPLPIFFRHLQWSSIFQILSNLFKLILQLLKKHIHAILPTIENFNHLSI